MAFKNIHTIDVAYDNKVYGNLIDPYEWNKNFTDIEQNITANAENLNDNFAMLSGSDGAANITSPDIIGGTDEPSTVSAQLISIVSRLLETYTITELDSKFEHVNANTVHTISFNADNGSFTITNNDGSTTVIDTNIEKIPVSVSLEKNGENVMLVITNYDGTTSSADVTNLLNVYTFIDSNTLRFEADKYDISAEVKKGSITLEHLADGVVSAIEKLRDEARAAKNDAEAAKTAAETAEANAEQSAKISESYAVGTSGIRSGETTDNAKYYSEQAGVEKDAAVAAKNAAIMAKNAAVETAENLSEFENEMKGTVKTYYGTLNFIGGIGTIGTVDDNFVLEPGVIVHLIYESGQSAPVNTLNVNNTGKIPLRTKQNNGLDTGSFVLNGDNSVHSFIYNGNCWLYLEQNVANTNYAGLVKLSDSVSSTNKSNDYYAATPYAVKQAYDKAREAKTVAQTAKDTADNIHGIFYGTCDSLSTENGKDVTVDESFKLVDDAIVFVKFNKANVENPPYLFLNVNNTGDIPIEIAEPEWVAGTSLCFIYKNGKWNAQQYPKANNQSVGLVALVDNINSNSDRFDGAAATPKAVKIAYDIANAALPKAGGTMTGNLVLNAAPTVDLGAATKKYVDDAIAGVSGGNISGDYLPLTGGTLTGAVNLQNSSLSLVFNENEVVNKLSYGSIRMDDTANSAVTIHNTNSLRFSNNRNANVVLALGKNALGGSLTGLAEPTTDDAAANKAYVDNRVSNFAIPKSSLLRFTNVTFAATTGVADTTYDGYTTRYDIPCTGVTTDYSADVRFAPADAVSGNFAPFCDTGNGVVKIYAKLIRAGANPGETVNITIPAIICTKMVD